MAAGAPILHVFLSRGCPLSRRLADGTRRAATQPSLTAQKLSSSARLRCESSRCIGTISPLAPSTSRSCQQIAAATCIIPRTAIASTATARRPRATATRASPTAATPPSATAATTAGAAVAGHRAQGTSALVPTLRCAACHPRHPHHPARAQQQRHVPRCLLQMLSSPSVGSPTCSPPRRIGGCLRRACVPTRPTFW